MGSVGRSYSLFLQLQYSEILLRLKSLSEMSPPKVKFVYFDLQGKGELTRLLLKCGKIDFEDFRFGFDDWPKHKPTTPFGQVPVIYWDGEEIAQCMAMEKFVARQADMVRCHAEDLWKHWPKLRFEKDQAEREKGANELLKEVLPKFLQPLEDILKKRGGEWYAGAGATFADLAMMVHLDFLHAPEEVAFKDMDNMEERRKILDAFPLVKANYERTSALPAVAAWKKERPAFNGF